MANTVYVPLNLKRFHVILSAMWCVCVSPAKVTHFRGSATLGLVGLASRPEMFDLWEELRIKLQGCRVGYMWNTCATRLR